MPNILYTLLIFPIEQVIELCYVFILRILRSPGLSIIGLSMAVSTLILPLYMMAEKQQQAEREKQREMKKDADNIKTVFKGDKRYMMLSVLYRQNNYHPVYALRSSFSLLVQIPFFIAAWHFLTNLEILDGESFKFIRDLGAPDGLLWGMNLLPILMTLITVVSGYIYTRGLEKRDKVQVYGIAAIFLILLYNSPAALVLYWTCNNIYNLVKNILVRTKNTEALIKGMILLISGCLSFYLLFLHDGVLGKRFLVFFLFLVLVLLFFSWKKIIFYLQEKIDIKNTALDYSFRTFTLSLIGLLLLIGVVVPSSLIASSVREFSFLEPFSSPLPYLGITLLQSAGILLWLVCLYFLFGRKMKLLLTLVLTAAFGLFMLNTFVFSGNYGFMLPDLHFSSFKSVSGEQKVINLAAMLVIAVVILMLLVWKRKKVFLSLQSIIVMALLCFGITNVVKINNEFQFFRSEFQISREIQNKKDLPAELEKAYTFSRTGRNVLLIVLDRAISGYIPYIFEEKPELLKSFTGFTYYPNTISFGPYTIHGMPGIFGGYYYTPLEIQKRTDELWRDKYYESMQVLPRIMAASDFKVTVNDQTWWMDYSLYDKYENITVRNIIGRYTKQYLHRNGNFVFIDYYKILFNNLIRFSFFKASPFVLHSIIYDGGEYLSILKPSAYSYSTIDSYAALYFLPEITEVTDETINYSIMMVNELTHWPAFMKVPDYVPSDTINRGESAFANEEHYHVNMAAFLLLARWFDFLKENGVYNNSRIIIVSDHGRNLKSPFSDNIILPNKKHVLQAYQAVLMVKDFDAKFDKKIDNAFMTVADVPHLVAGGIVPDLKNPFTGKELLVDKENGVTITSSEIWDPNKMHRFLYNIKRDEWLHVHTNIFDPENWSRVIVESK